jgi:hypothetical protein
MRRSHGSVARALRAVLITLLLGTWLDAGASAAMRRVAAEDCGEASGAAHYAGVTIASSGAGSHQACGGLRCPLVRHCGSANGAFVLGLVQAPSPPPPPGARLPIPAHWLPRTRHIAPPTPPPLAPPIVTA